MGTPIFSILIPVYSMWKMDEFGWGSSREVVEKAVNPDEIPLVEAGGADEHDAFTDESVDELVNHLGDWRAPMAAAAMAAAYPPEAMYGQQAAIPPMPLAPSWQAVPGYYPPQPAIGYYGQQMQQLPPQQVYQRPAYEQMDSVAFAALEYERAAERMAQRFAQDATADPASPLALTGMPYGQDYGDEELGSELSMPREFVESAAREGMEDNLAAAYEGALARLALMAAAAEGEEEQWQ